MRRSFENLDRPYQDFLIALLDVDTSPISERVASEAYYRLTGDAEIPPEKLAADLDGHFIRRKARPPKPPLPSADSETYCEWIHPSWRDIVIEFLASHKSRREQFLRSCSISGVSLALSIGGGSKGERSSPLLSEEGDWAALNRRVKELALSAEEPVYRRLIVVLHDALKNMADVGSPSRQPLNDMAHGFLEAIRCKWDMSNALLNPWLLGMYYDLSVLVTPLSPSPLLDHSWLHYIGRLEDDIGNEDCAANDLEPVLRFVELMQANEPRFLLQHGYPLRYEHLFSSCLAILVKYDYRDSRPRDTDDFDKELEYIEELRALCEEIAGNYPSLDDSATDVCAELEGQRDMAQEERDKLEEDRKAQDHADEEYRYYCTTGPPYWGAAHP